VASRKAPKAGELALQKAGAVLAQEEKAEARRAPSPEWPGRKEWESEYVSEEREEEAEGPAIGEDAEKLLETARD